MRPDEHKKKKNTAYKKKHGIPHKSSNEDASTEKGKTGSKKKVQTQDVNSKNSQLPSTSKDKDIGQAQAILSSSSSESSSDSEVPSSQKAPKRKQFSRRQIESNWQKYEVEPEAEEKPTARGQKYETLLSMAGEAMSRFRFRDELEWEDRQSQGDAPCATEESHSRLLINPADLAQSLSCIPIHRLLDIGEDLFPKEQLESIIQMANKNCAIYSAKEGQCHENDHSQTSTTKGVDSSTNTSTPSTSRCSRDSTTFTSGPESASFPHSTQFPAASGKADENSSRQGKEKLSQQSSRPSEQPLTLQDDDLDRLLDMDLEMKGDASNGSSVVTSSDNVLKGREKNNESEDLEEWLDGILD